MKNRYSNKDFSKNNLPNNRFNLYKDILKNRLSLLFSIGLIVLLFSIPLLLVSIFKKIALINVLNLDISDADKYREFFATNNTFNLLYTLGFIILGVGLSGIYQVVRRLVYGDNIIFKLDFKNGVKSNIKIFLFIFTLIGFINFGFQFIIYYLTDLSRVSYQISIIVIIVLIGILIPIIPILLTSSTIYSLPLYGHIKNSFLLSYRKWYFSFPIGLLNIGLAFLSLIPNDTVYYLFITFMPLVFSPFIILLNVIYSDSLFDEYINKDNFKEIYRKGLSDYASN